MLARSGDAGPALDPAPPLAPMNAASVAVPTPIAKIVPFRRRVEGK